MPFNTAKHASDVICVSIGLNLLFPFIPKVAQALLADIVTDPKEIVKNHFLNPKTVSEDDLRRIGEVARAIDRARAARKNHNAPPNWLRGLYIAFVFVGIFLLWSGYVDDFNGWCAILLAPPVIVVAVSGVSCFVRRKQFFHRIKVAQKNARRKSEQAAEQDEITEFVRQMTAVGEESSAS